MIPLIFLIAGIAGLYFGSGYVVETAKNIANKLKIPPVLIGLSIISIGTSIPEIMTNLFSGLKIRQGIEASGIAIGTNLGSDITQITFILGFTALFGTMHANKKLLSRDFFMVIFSILAVFFVGITGYNVSLLEGTIMIVIYIWYLYTIFKDEKSSKEVKKELKEELIIDGKSKSGTYTLNFSLMALGIAILIFASEMVVGSAVKLAEYWRVSGSFVGVMVIGVGTGLPELSTALRAIFKKAGDISLGTLIGSNITDPMLALPMGAIAAGSVGLSFDKNLLFFDIPFWLIASIVALYIFKKNMKISKKDKRHGLILITLYVLFVAIKLIFFLH
ncbi:MAG: calcium/sodium antiporter [Nanoarchaeota archaeon]|nr:calcium/sodium antiporter [Nanoarchaeota archaeon]